MAIKQFFFKAVFVFAVAIAGILISFKASATELGVKTFPIGGYEWTDVRASANACNSYCTSAGFTSGTVTATGTKTCAGAECAYISNFTTGTVAMVGNDNNCGCNSQFTCTCAPVSVTKTPDWLEVTLGSTKNDLFTVVTYGYTSGTAIFKLYKKIGDGAWALERETSTTNRVSLSDYNANTVGATYSYYATAVVDGVESAPTAIKSIVLNWPTCLDTDYDLDHRLGFNPDKKGTFNGNTDSCTDSSTVLEYYCSAAGYSNFNTPYTCPNGCIDGACASAPVVKSIQVISPNGGEQWEVGTVKRVSWVSTGYDKVRINVDCEGYSSGAIMDVPSGATGGSYGYTVPANWTNQNQCKVQVSENVNTLLNGVSSVNYDMSDGYFSIIYPVVKVVSPNGAEQWEIRKTYTVSWLLNNQSLSPSCAADLYQSGIDYPIKNLIASYSSSSYSWQVPDDLTVGQYKITVRCNSVDGFMTYSDSSDNYFSIIAPVNTTWDVSIKFDKANVGSFYPFSGNAGLLGTTYYKSLNETDNLYQEFIGREACTSSYWGDIFDKENARRAKGWYTERKKITDNKYKILIKGVSRADCGYETGYVKGELNLNSSTDWQITEVAKCSVGTSNKGQSTYCETGNKTIKFAAGSGCGGCCACSDSASVDIEVIVEKTSVTPVNKITVLSPNGGDVFTLNDTMKIAWTMSGSVGPAGSSEVWLYKEGAKKVLIKDRYTTSANFVNWVIPTTTPAGSDYKIRVASTDFPDIYDESDSYFSIVSPTTPYVQVTFPNGGDKFTQGETVNIKWLMSNLTTNGSNNIELIYPDGKVFYTIYASNILNTASYSWNTSTIPVGQYKIRITSLDPKTNVTTYDDSDASFNIVAATTSSIQVTSPNGGEKWVIGETYKIKWTSAGINKVWIKYSDGSGNAFLISSLSNNPGYFSWTIPSTLTPGNTYKIEVVDPETTILDWSDSYFSIVLSATPCLLPDGTLVKLPNDPKIYVIKDCKKVWIQTAEEFAKSGYIWSDVNVVASSTINSLPETSVSAPDVIPANIPDGAIIQATGDPDVYIVKYTGSKKFKRLILSPSVFKSYGHLKWGNIIKVDKATLDSFMTSNLVRSVKTGNMYSLSPNGDAGVRRFIKDIAALQRLGFDSSSAYEINETDEKSYDSGEDLD